MLAEIEPGDIFCFDTKSIGKGYRMKQHSEYYVHYTKPPYSKVFQCHKEAAKRCPVYLLNDFDDTKKRIFR